VPYSHSDAALWPARRSASTIFASSPRRMLYPIAQMAKKGPHPLNRHAINEMRGVLYFFPVVSLQFAISYVPKKTTPSCPNVEHRVPLATIPVSHKYYPRECNPKSGQLWAERMLQTV
jgi:hypothetical protein